MSDDLGRSITADVIAPRIETMLHQHLHVDNDKRLFQFSILSGSVRRPKGLPWANHARKGPNSRPFIGRCDGSGRSTNGSEAPGAADLSVGGICYVIRKTIAIAQHSDL